MNVKNDDRKLWLFATYIKQMDLLWRSLNGLKCSDHYDECSRMVMLNTRFFQYILKKKHVYKLKETTFCDLQ